MTSHFVNAMLLGKQLTAEEHADIPHYRAELHVHVLYKSIQVNI